MKTRAFALFALLLPLAAVYGPFAVSCGGGHDTKVRIWDPPGGYLYIEDVMYPETLEEGQPLGLRFTVNLPDDEEWTRTAEFFRGRLNMRIDVDVIDGDSAQYRLEFSGIGIPWPGERWGPGNLNQPPFQQFVWRFPEDFQVYGRYADGEHFDGVPVLPVGIYDVWVLTGDPPVGSLDYWPLAYFGSFEVVPAEDAA